MSQTADLEILFVSHKYPPATGGMEKQSYELISAVQGLTKVHRLVYQQEESIIRFFVLLNRRILKILKAHPGIRLIHFNDGLIAALSLRHRGYTHLKRVVTIHGLDIVFPWPYFQHKIIAQFKQFDRCIAVSHATAEALHTRGIPADKIEVIHNGVDHQPLAMTADGLRQLRHKYPVLERHPRFMITLGRPVKRKGFSWLLREVVPHLDQSVHLLMVGPLQQRKTWRDHIMTLLPQRTQHLLSLLLGYPSDSNVLRVLLRQPAMQHRATHLGKVPQEDLQLLLTHAQAFLMPNIKVVGDMEGFGLVCLEAAMAGTLVVAAALDGVTDAIQDRKNGILLPSADAALWIHQLNAIARAPQDYQLLRSQGRQYTLQHYGWDKMAKAYMSLFAKLTTCVRP